MQLVGAISERVEKQSWLRMWPSLVAQVPGTRFVPKDAELVTYYLYGKVTGQTLPEGVIIECDLYGNENPWDIWKCYNEKVVRSSEGEDLYMFTRLKRKNPTAKRVERKVGIGTWQGEAIGKQIMVPGIDQCVGFMKRFRFEMSQTDHDGAWIMHEYSLNPSQFPHDFQINDYVLCRLRKNDRIMKRYKQRKTLHPQNTYSCPDLDQLKIETLSQDASLENVQNGIKLEKENVNIQKDTELENVQSTFPSEEEFFNEHEDSSPNQLPQFGAEIKQNNIEAENKNVNMQKDTKFKNIQSIITFKEASSHELDQNFSPNLSLRFVEETKQNGIATVEENVQKNSKLENIQSTVYDKNQQEDNLSVNQLLQFEDEHILEMPISTMLDDQELFFEKEMNEFDDDFDSLYGLFF